ncbi:NlpC/P60 family putative phage cell wall peptidase [Rhodoblastus acidophilus]|uniref:NlpC/P60 family protein n=1 Tax=Rhodoblastus acidophilus TaxID=1074 RepID=UPI0022240A3B|nr:NlpC/P60 family protein [Rhodoblastus acidophilus]MCW2283378.1 NlpC/P60 family putative phage cell wall peptidase [Rhodoblastus acidophilus]MCW2332298.1 NlpC/P60 family putative phage cell wall peptidase [Rhodoblastus acidophilus]
MPQAHERQSVVAEARKWLLTPYRHAADIRGVGVDCGMFIVRVFVDLGLTPPFDPRPYAPDWMIHRNEEKYLEFFNRRCRRVQEPRPGDIVLFRYGRSYSHGGIVSEADPLAIIHAYHDAGCVVEERLSQNPALTDPRRKLAWFSIWPQPEF